MRIISVFILGLVFWGCGRDEKEFPTTYTFSNELFVYNKVFEVREDYSISETSSVSSFQEIIGTFENGIRNELNTQGVFRLDEVELISETELRMKGFHENIGDFDLTTEYVLENSGEINYQEVLPDSNVPLVFNRSEEHIESCYSIKVTQREPTPQFPLFQEVDEFPCDEFRVSQNLTLEVNDASHAIDDRIGIFISKQIFTK